MEVRLVYKGYTYGTILDRYEHSTVFRPFISPLGSR